MHMSFVYARAQRIFYFKKFYLIYISHLLRKYSAILPALCLLFIINIRFQIFVFFF